jgi:hypothetical protein
MNDLSVPDRYKIEEYDPELGWMQMTRAGNTIADAERELRGYNKNWPARRHRIVELNASRTAWEPM